VLKGKGVAAHGSGLMATNYMESFLAAQGNSLHDWVFYALVCVPLPSTLLSHPVRWVCAIRLEYPYHLQVIQLQDETMCIELYIRLQLLIQRAGWIAGSFMSSSTVSSLVIGELTRLALLRTSAGGFGVVELSVF
jgi:hypothetical protein